jgi:hypothetical protein
MRRYAVLRETDGENLPIGIAIERESDVTIVALDEFGLPRRISEPYRVLQRDLSTVEYKPGDPGYFEQVLLELQRAASISEIQEVPDATRDILIALYNDKVVKGRLAAPRVYHLEPATFSAWNVAVRRIAGFGAQAADVLDDANLRVAA